MQPLLIPTDFWKPGDSEGDFLHEISSGVLKNSKVDPDMIELWTNTKKIFGYQEFNAVLDLLSKSVSDLIFFPVELSTKLLFNKKEDQRIIESTARKLLAANPEHRFLVTAFEQNGVWTLVIFDRKCGTVYWGNPQNTPRAPIQLARLDLYYSGMLNIDNFIFINVILPSGSTSLPEMSVCSLASIVDFFAREISSDPLTSYDYGLDASMRQRFVACIAKECFFVKITTLQLKQVDEMNLSIVPFESNLTFGSLMLEFGDLNLEFPDDSQITETVYLKSKPYFTCQLTHKNKPMQQLICLVAGLTAEGKTVKTAQIIQYGPDCVSLSAGDIRAMLVGIIYTNNNRSETPKSTRPLVETAKGWHLTAYGFNEFIKGMPALTMESGKNVPFHYYARCRGRKANKKPKEELLLLTNGPKQKPTWIGMVRKMFLDVRRPMTIQEMIEYFIHHPTLAVDESFRQPVKTSSNSKTTYPLLAQPLRQALKLGSQPKTPKDILFTRASRDPVFYWNKRDVIYQKGALSYGGLLEQQNVMGTRRRECSPGQPFIWNHLFSQQDWYQGWVLPFDLLSQSVEVVNEKRVLTKIRIPAGILIEWQTENNPLYCANHGKLGLLWQAFGDHGYAETQRLFEPGDELGFPMTTESVS